jgi:hypothetical protein
MVAATVVVATVVEEAVAGAGNDAATVFDKNPLQNLKP